MRRIIVVILVVLLAAACGSSKSGGAKRLRVSAASDLSKAFEELGAKFKLNTGIAPEFSFSSSGMIVRQVKEGAPIDLFASASVAYVDDAIAAGKCDAASKTMYARGRLVIWTKDGGVAPPTQLADLADPRFKSLAIASPDHAPYGKAAKQALEKIGIWSQVEGRMQYGEDVRKTLTFAETGNVDAAIVALSLAIVTKGGSYVAVPPDLHDPLDQAMVACGKGPGADAARQFAAYVGSPEGRAIMMKYGFILPGETGP